MGKDLTKKSKTDEVISDKITNQTNQRLKKSKSPVKFWLIFIIFIIVAVSYFLWNNNAVLPLEITSIGATYHERHESNAIGNNRYAQTSFGDFTTVTVTVLTRPGATCEILVNGQRSASTTKSADQFGNASWNVHVSGRVSTVSVVITAIQGSLRASKAETYQVSDITN